VPWPTPSVVDVFAGESRRVADVVLALDERAFALPTRCPPWNVKMLLGHLYRDVDRILEYRDLPAGPPDTDGVSYWTRFDPVDDAPDISARARQIAAGHASGRALAEAFDGRWREAVAAARAMEPDRPIATFAPTLRLDEYLRTRVLELGVHGLDLADALGTEPWITSEGTEVVLAILRGILGDDLPGELGWDDLAFIEAGTGRRPITDAERAVLGAPAERFPLLA
jgi:uncharacterized protein (TIGR03083 family)